MPFGPIAGAYSASLDIFRLSGLALTNQKQYSAWMDIGVRLKAWREEKGLSQAKAAKLIGAGQRTWTDWETKGKPVSGYFAVLMVERLEGLGLEVQDLVRKPADDTEAA